MTAILPPGVPISQFAEHGLLAGGSGGGSAIRAQAGCKDADRLPEALETALSILKKKAGV